MSDIVLDLLFRADFFLDSHKRLYSAFRKNMPADAYSKNDYFNLPLVNLTIVNANLYFFEAVSCLASLLRNIPPDPTKEEISFHKLAEGLSDVTKASFRSKLDSVFSDYRKSGLENMRNKYVDHKDLKSSGDPTAAFINLSAPELVDSCSKLIDALKQVYQEYFPDGTANNYFSDFYSAG